MPVPSREVQEISIIGPLLVSSSSILFSPICRFLSHILCLFFVLKYNICQWLWWYIWWYKVPCNYTFTTQRRLTVGGHKPFHSIIQTSFHQVDLLSNFPHNYILSTIRNESPNYSRPVVCCCCSGKRCNYLRQCVSKYVGHDSRAWVERAVQLFLCASVSSSDHRV